jgi:DNA-binding transcriptional LysR family regulator
MDLLGALHCFSLVVETGSLSAAARRGSTSQSAVTRQVTQLEAHFGVRLLHRTTRRLSLTEDGEELLVHARLLLDSAAQMEEGLGRRRLEPVGHVRLGTSMAFGQFLASRLPDFLASHPGLSVELVLTDHVGNMIEARLDLATMTEDATDTSLVVRRVGEVGRLPVASPAYLARAGTPLHPQDLVEHNCLVHDTGGANSKLWVFNGEEGRVAISVHGIFSATVSGAVHQAALAGGGIAMLSELQVADDLRTGRLVRLLDGYPPVRAGVVIAYPSRRNLAPRTRVVLEFVVTQIQQLKRDLGAGGPKKPYPGNIGLAAD